MLALPDVPTSHERRKRSCQASRITAKVTVDENSLDVTKNVLKGEML